MFPISSVSSRSDLLVHNFLEHLAIGGFLFSTKIQSRFLAPTPTAAKTIIEAEFFVLLVDHAPVSLSIAE